MSVLARSANRRAVLGSMLEHGTTSRVELASLTGLSRPTVNSIIGDLVKEGMVEDVGATRASPGRSAALFRAKVETCVVVGIDLGGISLHAAVADLAGGVRLSHTIPTHADKPGLVPRIIALTRQLLHDAKLEPDSVAAVAIGTPGVWNRDTRRMEFAASIPELAHLDLAYQLSQRLGVEVTLDNDVNMAILGERWKGRAQNVQDAVFVTVGTGIGMGIIAGGRLQRGHSGGAGEVGFLPLRGDPFEGVPRQVGPMEDEISSHGISSRYDRLRTVGGEPPLADVRDIFSAAARGQPAALETIDETARQLALVIASVHAILDPERVVLGGGIGSNPLMVSLLRAHLQRLGRQPPMVEVSALEGRAVILGALAVGLEAARRSVGLEPTLASV